MDSDCLQTVIMMAAPFLPLFRPPSVGALAGMQRVLGVPLKHERPYFLVKVFSCAAAVAVARTIPARSSAGRRGVARAPWLARGSVTGWGRRDSEGCPAATSRVLGAEARATYQLEFRLSKSE